MTGSEADSGADSVIEPAAGPRPEPIRSPVVIGYNFKLVGVVGVGAFVMFLLLLERALTHTSIVDGLLAAAMAVVAARAAMVLLDSAPLMVADDRGVRVRVADEWCGLPWISISQYEVRPRRFPWSDGLLVFELHHPSHVAESVSPSSRRQLARNQRRHGVPLCVPLGVFTGVSRRTERSLSTRLDALADTGAIGHI